MTADKPNFSQNDRLFEYSVCRNMTIDINVLVLIYIYVYLDQ